MGVDFESWDDPEIQSLIERFEGMLDFKGHYFFDSDDFEEIIDFYFERNNIRKAGQAINIALTQYPLNVTFLIRKAHLVNDQGKPEEALTILKDAEFLDPTNVDVIMSKAALYSKMKLYDKAIEEYQRALSDADNTDEIYSFIAFEYENLGNYDKAIEYLAKALKANPEYESALYEIGFCYEITHQLDNGIAYFTDFLNIYPYSKITWFCLGVLNNAKGTYEAAIDAYDFVIAIDETFSSAYFNKANAYANMNEYHKAIEQYQETFLFEDPEAMTYFYIGECYEELEDYQNALDHYLEAIRIDEYLSEGFMCVGNCYELLDKPKLAIKYMHKAIEIEPDNAYFWYQLGETLFDNEETVRAIDALEKATSLEPQNSEMWDYYAFIFASTNSFSKAILILKDAIQQMPSDALLIYHLSSCLWMNGQVKESYLNLENALSIDFEKHTSLFDFFQELKNSSEILTIIETYRTEDSTK